MLTPDLLLGGWQLESSRVLIRGEVHSNFDPNNLRIKLFAPQHFSIFTRKPDRKSFSREVSDSERLEAAKSFDACCGRYTLCGSTYTEMIDFASFPNYEGKVITFRLTFDGQHLIQEGVYPLKSLGFQDYDGYLFETYSRVNL